MSALRHPSEHRVTALARRCREELTGVASVPLWSMSEADAGDALVLLTEARSQLEALLMRVLLRQAQAAGTAGGRRCRKRHELVGAASTQVTRARAHHMAHVAGALEHHDEVATALATRRDPRARRACVRGRCRSRHLPDEVDVWVPEAATPVPPREKAVEHDAAALRVLGRRVAGGHRPPSRPTPRRRAGSRAEEAMPGDRVVHDGPTTAIAAPAGSASRPCTVRMLGKHLLALATLPTRSLPP